MNDFGNKNQPKARWQLPRGLTRGVWEYVNSDSIAGDYDDYFALTRLFDLDEEVVARHLDADRNQNKVVADLGCGTGRALVPLVRAGFRGLAVDLSLKMLHIVQEKADEESLPIECLHANLVDLDGLADNSVDHAICLFSTLGMIQGRENRRKALQHVNRILAPGGVFVLHVHNFWFNLYDPGGVRWVLGSLLKSWTQKDYDAGDKFFNYRGVHNMFLHVFRRRELFSDLKQAGFRIRETFYLDAMRKGELSRKWFLGDLRANGWIVACEA
ncbi:MAG: ubiquinone/menaquinone biosynthesis C-methylase UbiE [Pirellulaceae bacterium]|jgi:ubiquinone/menaquinone biosynthesis C-methylase UbiE